jgi:hypothetical protein
MRRTLGRQRTRVLTLTLALTLAPAARTFAQVASQVSAAPATTTESRRADPKKILNLADYGRWNRITQTAISPDGRWMTYAYQPNDGDATL